MILRWGSAAENAAHPVADGSASRKALLGTTLQGKLGVLAVRSGTLQFDWSLSARGEADGNLAIAGEIPPAATSSLVLDLPAELAPQIDKGLVLGPQSLENRPPSGSDGEGEAPAEPNEKVQPPGGSAARQEPRPPDINPAAAASPALKRWRIELGGSTRFQLKLVPRALREAAGDLPLVRETRSYEVSPCGVEISCAMEDPRP